MSKRKTKATKSTKRKPAADHSDGPPMTAAERWQWAADAAAAVLLQCRELSAEAKTIEERAAILGVVVAAHALHAQATERLAGK